MDYYILIAAILPAFILLWYIYSKDSNQPEPISQILKGTAWGVASAFLALVFATPFTIVLGGEEVQSIWDCTYKAFLVAAVPEECAKAFCLYLFLRRNKYFDEYMDGIVYAACIGLGFAAFENIFYLFESDDWLTLGFTRGLMAVPGHFFFAVIMGYFFSLWRINGDAGSFTKMLFYPIMAHAIYDVLAFSIDISDELSGIIVILLFVFLNKMRKRCSRLIGMHLVNDNQ